MRSAHPDIVVMGGSAGAIEALKEILAGLPRDLPAAVFVVVHISPTAPSALSAILARVAQLPVRRPVDSECYEVSHVYVALPDQHLVLEGDRIGLTRGPRENRSRPSVDVLFRSAARAAGDRVVGVLLSGNLDDGAVGMAEIKARGGVTIVQDPADAAASGMPEATMRLIRPDRVLAATAIADAIVQAVDGGIAPTPQTDDDPPDPPGEELAMQELNITCPDCSGVLETRSENGYLQFECQVGHRFSEEVMLSAHADGVEAAMWVAVRVLEERVRLTQAMAERFNGEGHESLAERLMRESHDAALRAELIRRAIAEGETA